MELKTGKNGETRKGGCGTCGNGAFFGGIGRKSSAKNTKRKSFTEKKKYGRGYGKYVSKGGCIKGGWRLKTKSYDLTKKSSTKKSSTKKSSTKKSSTKKNKKYKGGWSNANSIVNTPHYSYNEIGNLSNPISARINGGSNLQLKPSVILT
jgi:hypothetical protein